MDLASYKEDIMPRPGEEPSISLAFETMIGGPLVGSGLAENGLRRTAARPDSSWCLFGVRANSGLLIPAETFNSPRTSLTSSISTPGSPRPTPADGSAPHRLSPTGPRRDACRVRLSQRPAATAPNPPSRSASRSSPSSMPTDRRTSPAVMPRRSRSSSGMAP